MLSAAALICTRNRLEPLLACLASIAKQTYPIAQVVVVDSSDRALHSLPEFLAAFSSRQFGKTDLVYLHTQPGLTFQRNQGIAQAKADLVFFFDDDVVLDPHYVETLMETFHAHPEYGGGMGTMRESRAGIRAVRRPSDYLRRFFLLNISAAGGRMQRSGLPTHAHGRSEFMEVEILSGALSAYRSDVLEEFKFDEAVTGYGYMEDVDFSYRVSRRYRLFYDPRAVVEHRHTPIPPSEVATYRKMYLVNHHYFFFKNIYPGCHWCLVPYLWAVVGLFAMALLARNWPALLGYGQGIRELLGSRPYRRAGEPRPYLG